MEFKTPADFMMGPLRRATASLGDLPTKLAEHHRVTVPEIGLLLWDEIEMCASASSSRPSRFR